LAVLPWIFRKRIVSPRGTRGTDALRELSLVTLLFLFACFVILA